MNSKEMFGGYCDPSGDQREAKCKMTDCPGKNLNNRWKTNETNISILSIAQPNGLDLTHFLI